MFNLLWAEWLKIWHNRPFFVFTLGLIPISMAILLIILAISYSLGVPTGMTEIDWQEQIIESLTIPNNVIGQLLFIAFGATVFAGEYNWKTWKILVPIRRRINLLLCKFLVTAISIFLVLQVIALIAVLGTWGIAGVTGLPVVANQDDFLTRYFATCFSVFITLMLGTIFGSLGAIFSRSIGGGIVVGISMVIADGASALIFLSISMFLQNEAIASLSHFTANFSVQNTQLWLTEGFTIMNVPAHFSFIVLFAWISIGMALSISIFLRRDLA